MRLRFNNKNKATGLVEVLTVLAILAMTMLSVVGISVRSMRQVKKNEIEDRAVALQLRGIEYAKSPALVTLDETNYSVFIDKNLPDKKIELKPQSQRVTLSKSNCDPQSIYYVDTGNTGDMICNQIKVTKVNNLYQIESIIVYKSYEELEESKLLGYRIDAQ